MSRTGAGGGRGHTRRQAEQNKEEGTLGSFLKGLEDSLDQEGGHGRFIALVKAKLESQEEEHEEMFVSTGRE